MNNTWQPLEEHVKNLLEKNPNDLPNRGAAYWERYTHLVAGLREYVYPNVNAGLACLSKSPGIYTDHGPSHFDEVVRYAGLLLEQPGNSGPQGFRPYELYLLLCAIRLHDAGNIDGRDEHEKKVSFLLEKYGGNINHDSAESELICGISEAHGGFSMSGDKDTISRLPRDDTPVGAIVCSPRHIAAIVRFADEVCEHRSRAAIHHITSKTLPDENKLFQYYAASITGAVPDRREKSFRMNISIDTKYLQDKYPTPKKEDGTHDEKFLIDEVLDRLVKLDRERIYCNQFLNPNMQTNHVEVQIKLVQTKKFGATSAPGEVEKFEFKIPPQTGYPEASASWKSRIEKLTGQQIAARAAVEWK